MSDLTPGLFGKLPAHGDFVARGWPEEVVAPLDAWLTAALTVARAGLDDAAFAGRMAAAPMWQGYLPPGAAGPAALHVALAPSIDKAGRYFFLAGGVAGAADAVWAQAIAMTGFGQALDAAMYDALATVLDADRMLETLAAAVSPPDRRARLLAGLATPCETLWWVDDPADGAPVVLRAAAADAALVARLLGEGTT